MSERLGQDHRYPPAWQSQVALLRETEEKLLGCVAEVRGRVSETELVDVAARRASLDEILGYLEDSARQLVGLIRSVVHLQEETIRSTKEQTLRQVQDELHALIRRVGLPAESAVPSEEP